MSRTIYAPGPVTKRRWWEVSTPGRDEEPTMILAETRSKARYSRWLDIRDYCSYRLQDLRVLATSLDPVYERPVVQRPISPPAKRRSMLRDDWLAEGRRIFGPKASAWKFCCPICGETQSMQDFVDAGMTTDQAESRAYFSCIGRWIKGRGCDWTLGGLLQVHGLEIIDQNGAAHPVFEFAETSKDDAEQPQAQAVSC